MSSLSIWHWTIKTETKTQVFPFPHVYVNTLTGVGVSCILSAFFKNSSHHQWHSKLWWAFTDCHYRLKGWNTKMFVNFVCHFVCLWCVLESLNCPSGDVWLKFTQTVSHSLGMRLLCHIGCVYSKCECVCLLVCMPMLYVLINVHDVNIETKQ